MKFKNILTLSSLLFLTSNFVSCNRNGAKLYITAPDYVYLNQEIDKTKINAYEMVNGKITKLDSDNLILSQSKFTEKGTGVYSIDVTSKTTGNKASFIVNVLESYEVNEQAFVNAIKELNDGDMEANGEAISIKKSTNPTRKIESEIKNTQTYNFTRYKDVELLTIDLKTEVIKPKIQEKKEYTAMGAKKVYDKTENTNMFYLYPCGRNQEDGTMEYIMDYELPKGNITQSSSSSLIYSMFSASSYNRYSLVNNKYVYEDKYEMQTYKQNVKSTLTFENGKLLKSETYRSEKMNNNESEYNSTFEVTRKETTNPIKETKKLNYQYIGTNDLERDENGYVINLTTSSPTTFSFDLKFFEDYDSSTKKYIDEVAEGYFCNKEYFDFEIQSSGFTVSFDSSAENLKVNITCDSTWTEGNHCFSLVAKQSMRNLNTFIQYINGGDLMDQGVGFTIKVTAA